MPSIPVVAGTTPPLLVSIAVFDAKATAPQGYCSSSLFAAPTFAEDGSSLRYLKTCGKGQYVLSNTSADTQAPLVNGCGVVRIPSGPYNDVVKYGPTSITAMDNEDCGIQAATIPFSLYPIGSTIVTVNFTDKSGNRATCSKNISVFDSTPPVLNCPVGVYTTDPGLNTATLRCVSGKVLNGTRCMKASLTSRVSLDTVNQYPTVPLGLGTVSLSLVATTINGINSTCTSNITIIDIEPPVIFCPKTLTLPENASSLTSFVPFDLLVSDNDFVKDVVALIARNNSISNFSYFSGSIKDFMQQYVVVLDSGQTVSLRITARDASGNAAIPCTLNITVVRPPLTTAILSLSDSLSTLTVAVAVSELTNISTKSTNMTTLQVTLLAPSVSTIISSPNVSVISAFSCLDNLGNLPPAALREAEASSESATLIRLATLSLAATVSRNQSQTNATAQTTVTI
jgi:hypothetical protein